MRVRYINMKTSFGVETVDVFNYNTKEEKQRAKNMLEEYKVSDRSNEYYLSQRPSKHW